MNEFNHLIPMLAPLLVALPISLVFLLLFLGGILGMFKAKSSKSWPSVQGSVVESYIREKQKSDRIKYKPVVEYSYQVQGREYRSQTINFGGRRALGNRAEADEYMQGFQEGKSVKVFYNPRNHRESCLLPGQGFGGVAAAVGGFGFIFVAGILLVQLQALL